jgi:hypothetical protein
MNIDKIIKLSNLYLNASTSYCQITLDKYNNNLKKYLTKLMHESIDRKEDARFIRPEELLSELRSLSINNEELIQAIVNKNESKLYDLLFGDVELRKKIPYELSKKIRLYCDTSPVYSEENLESDYNRILNETKENMERLCSIINERINNIKNYQGTVWKLIPIVSSTVSKIDELDYLEPADSASVVSTADENVFFGLYQTDNKLEIEDVIEDEIDIESTGWQADYYKLVNEMRNPGSSSTGKDITLYTARPVTDRNFYLSTSTLPNNVYLTSSLYSAEGLATELAGTQPARDIYKVRINTEYLLKTLDTPTEKHYRVVAGPEGAPVKIELL